MSLLSLLLRRFSPIVLLITQSTSQTIEGDYAVYSEPLSYADAVQYCSSKEPAGLWVIASVHNTTQETIIRAALESTNTSEAWVGAVPTTVSGKGKAWVWADGTPWDYDSDRLTDGNNGATSEAGTSISLMKASNDNSMWNVGGVNEEFGVVCHRTASYIRCPHPYTTCQNCCDINSGCECDQVCEENSEEARFNELGKFQCSMLKSHFTYSQVCPPNYTTCGECCDWNPDCVCDTYCQLDEWKNDESRRICNVPHSSGGPYCLKVTTGNSESDDGTLRLNAYSEQGAQDAFLQSEKSLEKNSEFIRCYPTKIAFLKVWNDSNDCWTGTIQLSTDYGVSYSYLSCTNCTPSHENEEISNRIAVDGDDNYTALPAAQYCSNSSSSNRCTIHTMNTDLDEATMCVQSKCMENGAPDDDCCAIPSAASCADGFQYFQSYYGCSKGLIQGQYSSCCVSTATVATSAEAIPGEAIPGVGMPGEGMPGEPPTWIPAVWLDENAHTVIANIGEAAFNAAFTHCPVVEYIRNGQTTAVYVRLTYIHAARFNAYKLFTESWNAEDNVLMRDFRLYDSLEDARADNGAWSYCNYENNEDRGFPLECGKKGRSDEDRYFSMPGGKKQAPGITSGVGFRIYTGSDCPADKAYDDESPCPHPYNTCDTCCDINSDCKCDQTCEYQGAEKANNLGEFICSFAKNHFEASPLCPPSYNSCDGCCDWNDDCSCSGQHCQLDDWRQDESLRICELPLTVTSRYRDAYVQNFGFGNACEEEGSSPITSEAECKFEATNAFADIYMETVKTSDVPPGCIRYDGTPFHSRGIYFNLASSGPSVEQPHSHVICRRTAESGPGCCFEVKKKSDGSYETYVGGNGGDKTEKECPVGVLRDCTSSDSTTRSPECGEDFDTVYHMAWEGVSCSMKDFGQGNNGTEEGSFMVTLEVTMALKEGTDLDRFKDDAESHMAATMGVDRQSVTSSMEIIENRRRRRQLGEEGRRFLNSIRIDDDFNSFNSRILAGAVATESTRVKMFFHIINLSEEKSNEVTAMMQTPEFEEKLNTGLQNAGASDASVTKIEITKTDDKTWIVILIIVVGIGAGMLGVWMIIWCVRRYCCPKKKVIKEDEKKPAQKVSEKDAEQHANGSTDPGDVIITGMTENEKEEMEKEHEKMQRRAEKFIPPANLPEMAEWKQKLEEFQEKQLTAHLPGTTSTALNNTTTAQADKKEAEHAIKQVREILKEQASHHEDPKLIGAVYNMYHGANKAEYDIGHTNGSGKDPDHERVVASLRSMSEKCKDAYPDLEQTLSNPIVLVKYGIELKSTYEKLVSRIAQETGAEYEKAGVKGLYRIVEKTAMIHGKMQHKCNNVFDVLRGMLVFESDAEIEKSVKKLAEETDVVRVKERLHNDSRTSEGWGDVMVNFRMKADPECTFSAGAEDYVCELQFARKDMLLMRKRFGGHAQYFKLRAATELHEVNGFNPSMSVSEEISKEVEKMIAIDDYGPKFTKLDELLRSAKEAESKKAQLFESRKSEKAKKQKDVKALARITAEIDDVTKLLQKMANQMRDI